MMPDQDIRAVSAVFRHLKLSHNDVTLPDGRRMPSECVYAHCTCVWAADGASARVTTPWGLFDVDLRVTPVAAAPEPEPPSVEPTEKAARRQAALRRIMYDKEPGALLVFHCKGEEPVAWLPFEEGFPPWAFVCPACGATGLREKASDPGPLTYDIVVLGSADDQTAGLPRIPQE